MGTHNRHGVGANNPPKTIFDTIDALYTEASAWFDGTDIETDEQAEALGNLMVMLREAGKVCQAECDDKMAPVKKAKAEIDALYKPPLDNVDRALKAAKAVRDRWLKKKQAILDEQARIAREEADRVRREALEAMQSSRGGDLGAREQAESIAEAARRAEFKALALAKATPKAVGGRKTVSKTWQAEIVNSAQAAAYCWERHRPDMEWLTLHLVRKDVKAGRRDIPGVNITEVGNE